MGVMSYMLCAAQAAKSEPGKGFSGFTRASALLRRLLTKLARQIRISTVWAADHFWQAAWERSVCCEVYVYPEQLYNLLSLLVCATQQHELMSVKERRRLPILIACQSMWLYPFAGGYLMLPRSS